MKRLAGFGVFCAAALLDFVWSVTRFERGINYDLRARWSQKWGRVLLRVLGVRVISVGVPPPGGVLACNHLGYLDIAVLASTAPMIFVSKSEVRQWPVLGWLARAAGTLFIDRTRKSGIRGLADDFRTVMRHKVVLTLFPEGTTSDGRTVLHFHSSLLEAPASHNLADHGRVDWLFAARWRRPG